MVTEPRTSGSIAMLIRSRVAKVRNTSRRSASFRSSEMSSAPWVSVLALVFWALELPFPVFSGFARSGAGSADRTPASPRARARTISFFIGLEEDNAGGRHARDSGTLSGMAVRDRAGCRRSLGGLHARAPLRGGRTRLLGAGGPGDEAHRHSRDGRSPGGGSRAL